MAFIIGGGPISVRISNENTAISFVNGHTTQEDLGVLRSFRQVLVNMLLGHEAHSTLPYCGRVVQDVEDPQPSVACIDQLFDVFFKKNIVGVDVSVNERKFRLVVRVFESCSNDLQHGRDSTASSKHSDVVGKIGRIVELTLGSFNLEIISNLQGSEVLGNIALRI
jgi:hypothetical protein